MGNRYPAVIDDYSLIATHESAISPSSIRHRSPTAVYTGSTPNVRCAEDADFADGEPVLAHRTDIAPRMFLLLNSSFRDNLMPLIPVGPGSDRFGSLPEEKVIDGRYESPSERPLKEDGEVKEDAR